MSEGLSFGIPYRSQLIYRNTSHQGISPVESSPNLYRPVIFAGGELIADVLLFTSTVLLTARIPPSHSIRRRIDSFRTHCNGWLYASNDQS
jgi:hypothetical protein